MGRLIDCNDVYNAIQITTDNFGVIKGVVESNMLTMLSKIETVEAIPLDKVKQAREEMESKLYKGIPETTGFTWQNLGINMCLAILDKLIAESEGKE